MSRGFAASLLRAALLAQGLVLCACAHEPPAPEFIVPKGSEFVSDMFGYSQAVRVGPWIFVSAQVGFDTQTRGFPKDFKKQVQLSFANLEAVLKLAGANLTDVVELTSYQIDMTRFDDVVTIHNDVFGDHHPAWTVVGVTALPLPDMQFQVKAIAYAPERRGTPPEKPADSVGDAPAK
jgi:enamine deaminase RidA (YjgF/YER057c/UK114 family)